MVHPEMRGGSPHRASARDGKKVANVIPVDHGAIRHRGVCLPKHVSNTIEHPLECGVARAVIRPYADKYGPIPNGGHRSSRLALVVQPDRFRTTGRPRPALRGGEGRAR